MLDSPVISATEMCPRAPRSPCNYAVTIQRGMSRTSGTLTNISASGAFLELNSEEQVGSVVLLLFRFSIPNSGRVYVSISARICRKSEESGVIGYGIQWIQATCDDRPEGIRHLVEKVLIGTTGRIQVLRNRENTERIAYTFDFAELNKITQHALAYAQELDGSEPTNQSDMLPSVTIPESTKNDSNREEKELPTQTDTGPAELSPIISPESISPELAQGSTGVSKAEGKNKTDRSTPSTSGKVFALGGNDSEITAKHADKEDEIEPKAIFAPVAVLPEDVETVTPEEDLKTAEIAPEPVSPPSRTDSTVVDRKLVELSDQSRNPEPSEVKLQSIREDRRASARSTKTHKLTTTMVIKGLETDVLMRNISTGGALIQIRSTPPELNSTLTLKIQTPSQKRAIRINGIVVRVMKQESRNCQFAIRFSDTLHRGHAIELKKFFQEFS